jgi:uncharacterized membrane-anchored protein YhcB (DUF1043 family)
MRYATNARVELARTFAQQFDALERHACTLQEWLMLKFSCTEREATTLLRAMERAKDAERAQEPPTP